MAAYWIRHLKLDPRNPGFLTSLRLIVWYMFGNVRGMPTPRRIILDDVYYHVYNRGNHRDPIFHSVQDYGRFLWVFTDQAAENNIEVAAYCLMPNHFHSLLKQRPGGDMTRHMASFGVSYAKYFNKVYGQVGHVFQGRFKSRAVVDPEDLIQLTGYIHRNPIGLVGNILEYEWSSLRAYLGEVNKFCDPNDVKGILHDYGLNDPDIYLEFVKNPGV